MHAGLIVFFQTEVWQLLSATGPVPRAILVLLLAFSVLSWAVIFRKYQSFSAARRESLEFLRIFRSSKKLSDIRASCQALKSSPLCELFLNGYREIENQVVVTENPGKPRVRSVDSIHRSIQIAASSELTRMEHWLTFLATTGSVTPFIGLFGTVWGIIDAFYALGNAGTATLHSVGPGISEALITTAAGLFAAIPAVIGYNHFVQRLKEFGTMMDDFGLEFVNIVERHFA